MSGESGVKITLDFTLPDIVSLKHAPCSYCISNACKDISLAVNKWKTKYMEVGHHRAKVANDSITVRSNSYEKVKNFTHLGSLRSASVVSG